MENNRLFYEELKKEYKNNKKILWKTLGGFIAFNYNYFEKINKVNDHEKYLTVKDLINDNIAIKLSVQLMIEETLKSHLNDLAETNFLDRKLDSIKNDYDQAVSERQNEDLSTKNFAEFIWIIQEYKKEIKWLVADIIKEINEVNIHFVSLKYKKQGEHIYRNSPFRLAEINSLISQAKEVKRKSKTPTLTSISDI